MTFGKQFFIGHQRVLLWLLTAPAIRLWFRWVLCIHGGASSVSKRKILAILPNAIWWEDGGKYVAEFRTHAKFSKRLYYAFRPLWWAMHAWDWLIADRWVPELSFGFATLTKYPYPGDATANTVDGLVWRVNTGGETWATMHDNADGTSAVSDDPQEAFFYISTHATIENFWYAIARSFFLFDTAALTSSATISAVVMSLWGTLKADNQSLTPDIDIYTSTPASNTNLGTGDYDLVGSTSQTGSPISYASFSISGYNDFTFNATGRENISKTGISKFSGRNANYDAANSPNTWMPTELVVGGYFADQTGTANDPKLVVTYTLPASTQVGRIILEQRSDGTIGG